MPTYVYACKNCGHRFEKYQSFSEDSLTVCPECDEQALRKVFDSVGVVFKGSGFYSTDSAASKTSANSANSGGSSQDSASSSSGSSASSSDSAGSKDSSSTSKTTATAGSTSSE
ncbi:FmdB family transcriptional regulator [Brachybacterium endophyticum]|uniref:FmdB family transcriptional regulator n=1 Tax=Brachybacterium endophyticum TaxID=2182385 RepID=A0A2U2RM89_9MICO|nr:FmdB family zinc ribbon protein [Brachybacterium endophyticum]PWH06951.1 FmdB family transcriptional regulator [Brachybacterium endophyticum]